MANGTMSSLPTNGSCKCYLLTTTNVTLMVRTDTYMPALSALKTAGESQRPLHWLTNVAGGFMPRMPDPKTPVAFWHPPGLLNDPSAVPFFSKALKRVVGLVRQSIERRSGRIYLRRCRSTYRRRRLAIL